VIELENLKNDDTKGQVVRSKAANELAQLVASKDDTPLNRMKITNAALLKKQAPLLEKAKAARQVAAKVCFLGWKYVSNMRTLTFGAKWHFRLGPRTF